jgi:hypothetical protein
VGGGGRSAVRTRKEVASVAPRGAHGRQVEDGC